MTISESIQKNEAEKKPTIRPFNKFFEYLKNVIKVPIDANTICTK